MNALKSAGFTSASWDVAPITLDTIKVSTAGIYPIGKIPSDKLTKGMKLAVYMLVVDESAGTVRVGDVNSDVAFKIAEEESASAVLINGKGDVIEEVPDDLDVSVVSYLKADVEYTPAVTATENDSDNGNISSSGGGCNLTGKYLILLFFVLGLMLKLNKLNKK